jgi:hypothetical protein
MEPDIRPSEACQWRRHEEEGGQRQTSRFGTVMVKRSVAAAKAMVPGKIVSRRKSLVICFFRASPASLRAECDHEALKAALNVKLTMKGGRLFPAALSVPPRSRRLPVLHLSASHGPNSL